ncbi:hypothetical protein PG984_009777 [Apiospora sp. TS-2023a]
MASYFLVLIASLVFTTPSSSISVDGSGHCYKHDGTLQQGNWLPCNPEAKVSYCCDAYDFCMSNGLCLNAAGNQWITSQGCTTSDWDCDEICNSTTRGSDGEGYVWFCSAKDSAGSVKYCCGSDNSCCNHPNLQSIPVATAVFHPPQPGVSSSISASSSTSSIHPAEPSQSPCGSNCGNDNAHTLTIGLGVGIPLGLALLGGIVFLGLQFRKWTAAAHQSTMGRKKEEEEGQPAVAGGGGSSLPIGEDRQHLPQRTPPSELNSNERRELYGG